MDTIIIENGIEMLCWTDSEGNNWKAEYDAVRFLGKECFEQILTDFTIELGSSWEVTFKDADTNGLLPEPTDEDYEYSDCTKCGWRVY